MRKSPESRTQKKREEEKNDFEEKRRGGNFAPLENLLFVYNQTCHASCLPANWFCVWERNQSLVSGAIVVWNLSPTRLWCKSSWPSLQSFTCSLWFSLSLASPFAQLAFSMTNQSSLHPLSFTGSLRLWQPRTRGRGSSTETRIVNNARAPLRENVSLPLGVCGQAGVAQVSALCGSPPLDSIHWWYCILQVPKPWEHARDGCESDRR